MNKIYMLLLSILLAAGCTEGDINTGPNGDLVAPDVPTGDGSTGDAPGTDGVADTDTGTDTSVDSTKDTSGDGPSVDATTEVADGTDTGPGDTGPGDTGPGDTGPGDTGPGDTNDGGTTCPGGDPICPAAGGCCDEGESCFEFGCAVAGDGCLDNGDCLGDTYCFGAAPPIIGQCLPYGTGGQGSNPECKKGTVAGVFYPALQCEWAGPPEGDAFPDHKNVLGSPTVISFPFAPNPSGAGGVGTGGQVVFISYELDDGGLDSGNCCGVIRVIDGATCEQLWSLNTDFVVGGSNPAIGDLDLDGNPEIVALAQGGGLVAFSYDAASQQFVQHWHSTEADGTTEDTFGDGQNRWNGPSLADITGDGHPEVLYEGNIYDHNGVKLAPGLGWQSYQQGMFPIVADVDLDGEQEIMLGAVAHRFDEATQTLVAEDYVTTPPGTGHIALADFGDWTPGMPSNVAEVVLVQGGVVTIRSLDGNVVFGPYTLPGGGTGGPPTIADFDGDGKPEFAAAGRTQYSVFDMDCVGDPVPDGCSELGVLWSKLSQDKSSNKTGSSVFDFEADGKAEAVYGDECFVRTYDGTNGDVLYSGPRSSCTWHELPVIADVDGDFRTEIVIGSNNNCDVECPEIDPIHGGLRCDDNEGCPSGFCLGGLCRCAQDSDCVDGFACAAMLVEEEDGQGQVCRAAHTGKLRGIRVYNDYADSWAQSRRIWNQHAYYVTNIDEDGRVPTKDEVVANWTEPGLNDFRRNSQGDAPAQGASDLTIKAADDAFDCGDGDITITAEACNRGVIPVGSGINVAFYASEPTDVSTPVCTGQTTVALGAGECEAVSCTLLLAELPDGGFWATIDDPISGTGSYLECIEDNNLGASDFLGCK